MTKYFSFKIWMEDFQKDFEFFKSMFMGKLNKKGEEYNTSTTISSIKQPENLINILDSLGEFKNLNDDLQSQVKGKIANKEGTLGDLIRIMAEKIKK